MTTELEFATETYWFALDADGYLGFLSSGFGPIPGVLAWEDELAASQIEALLGLPVTSAIRSHTYPGGVSVFVDLAARGVYTFQWSDYHGPYQPAVHPERPLCVSDLPQELANLLDTVRFATLRFGTATEITQAMLADDLRIKA